MLATLAEAGGAMKMGELAEALVITRGGLTKLVDRLVKAGLIERTFCETDRRVSYATLLPAGAELLDEMLPVVSAELQVAFGANISDRRGRKQLAGRSTASAASPATAERPAPRERPGPR